MHLQVLYGLRPDKRTFIAIFVITMRLYQHQDLSVMHYDASEQIATNNIIRFILTIILVRTYQYSHVFFQPRNARAIID